MNIESALSSAKLAREYVTAYTSALNSEVLDDRLFADMATQKSFFSKKLQVSKSQLRDSLFGGRGKLSADLRDATGDDKAALETAIAGIDAELSTL